MTRYSGWYASRTRGTRARLAHPASDGGRLTAATRSSPSPARGVPRWCASWPWSPTRRSSPASSCKGSSHPCRLRPAASLAHRRGRAVL